MRHRNDGRIATIPVHSPPMASDHPSPSKPPAPDWLLYLGIFLIFGPLGMLFGMVWDNASGWAGALVMAVFSGTIAVGWSYAFTARKMWLLALVIPFSLVVPFFVFPWLGAVGLCAAPHGDGGTTGCRPARAPRAASEPAAGGGIPSVLHSLALASLIAKAPYGHPPPSSG